MNLDIDYLKKNAKMIHWFGLGFIQVKLNDFERLHFYTDKLPKTTTEEEIHNHRYNFVSTILKGALWHDIYEVRVIEGFTTLNQYWLTEETCKENDKKSFPTYPCNIELITQKRYLANDGYYIHHETFHRVYSADAITHVRRGAYKKDFAQIIFPVGMKPACPFSVKRPESELWEIVEQSIKE